jgi:nicotinamide-nucleotide amidase
LGRKMIPGDEKMLSVPINATIFKNDYGFAPGFALNKNQSLIIAMPGVPREMQGMLENEVLPYLFQVYEKGYKEHCTVRTILMRESEINDLIAKMKIPLNEITWGVTTTPGMNTITFVSKDDYTFGKELIIGEAQEVFANRMLMPESINLEMELLQLLEGNASTIAVAESCTGGLISKRITDIPGSSVAFLGGLVAYSNDAKMNLLNISRNALRKYGAVSEEIAREMAVGVRERFNATIGISTTGIAGPGGGTEKKPVGTVCFGIATPDGVDSFTESITMDRERVRFYASQYILNKVRLYLKDSQ